MPETIFIVGRKNPDNDSIASAVGLAYLENELTRRSGGNAEYVPLRLGPLPPETQWVFEQHGMPAPQLVDHVEPGSKLILVDHSETLQAVDGVEGAELLGVIDHHRLGDISTPQPTFISCRPWGSTATIISRMFQHRRVGVPPSIGDALLSAILTDTHMTKSPATAKADLAEISYLESVTGRDYEAFGRRLYDCRGAEAEIPVEHYADADANRYEVDGERVLVLQHETFDLEGSKARWDEVRSHLGKVREEGGYGYILMLVTGIPEEGSWFIVVGDHGPVDSLFGIDTSNPVWMPGIMSRKKQVVPRLLA